MDRLNPEFWAALICLVGGALYLIVPPNAWKTLRTLLGMALRIALYQNPVVRALRSTTSQLIAAAIVPVYYLALDVYGDKWQIFTKYPAAHEVLFVLAAVVTFLFVVARKIAEWYEGKSDRYYLDFINTFGAMTAKLIRNKILMIQESVPELAKNSHLAKKIFHPERQINLILTEAESLLRTHFSIPSKNQLITIACYDGRKKKTQYKFRTQSWDLPSAQHIMAGPSLARTALDKREPIFFADKRVLAAKGYHLSERDRKKPTGSIFCYPVVVKTPDYEDRYVISISTYGPALCNARDRRHRDAIEDLLIDIGRRLELELFMLSLTTWQKENSSARNQSKNSFDLTTETLADGATQQ